MAILRHYDIITHKNINNLDALLLSPITDSGVKRQIYLCGWTKWTIRDLHLVFRPELDVGLPKLAFSPSGLTVV